VHLFQDYVDNLLAGEELKHIDDVRVPNAAEPRQYLCLRLIPRELSNVDALAGIAALARHNHLVTKIKQRKNLPVPLPRTTLLEGECSVSSVWTDVSRVVYRLLRGRVSLSQLHERFGLMNVVLSLGCAGCSLTGDNLLVADI
jgi:hypothetical protein